MKLLSKLLQLVLQPYRHPRSRTVRYAFPMVFVSALLLLASVASLEGKPEVLLEVSPTQVVIGEEAYLDVKVRTTSAINALTIIISAPTDKVLMDTVQVSNSVITLWTEEPRVDNGKIILRGGTFRRGFVGEHTIARIAFTPATSGTFAFTADNIELVAGDGAGTVIRPDAELVRSDTLYSFASREDLVAVEDKPRFELAIREQLGITDRAIGLRDISRFMSAWSTKATSYDFDGDGAMTFRDFAILLAYSFGV